MEDARVKDIIQDNLSALKKRQQKLDQAIASLEKIKIDPEYKVSAHEF